jgi:hypothetical protein
MYPYIMQGTNIVIIINNESHTISKSHITYDRLKEAIKAQDWATVKNLVDPQKVVLNYGNGNISIKGDTIFWKDRELHNALTSRMIEMLQEDFPIDPLANFMDNLMTNPSKRAVTELYGFLEVNNLPITPDGCFLAYKKVNAEYKDCHSNTIDNSVGQVVEMERNAVDDNFNNTCSSGLHFCSREYLDHFYGDHIMIVKINPRDVVSFPRDYNNSKGRCCRYEVIGELGINPEDAFDAPVQENANGVVEDNQ